MRLFPLGLLLSVLVTAWPTDKAQAQQYFDLNCPGRWAGSHCICPDGSLANYVGRWPHGRVVCPQRQQQQQQRPQSICPRGSAYCSINRSCCSAGNKCSASGCIPEDADDCSPNKGYCKAGTKCSRNGKYCIPADNVDCGEYSCGPGKRCAKNYRYCLAEGQVECGKTICPTGGYICSAKNECVRIADTVTRIQSTKFIQQVDKPVAIKVMPYATLARAAYSGTYNRDIIGSYNEIGDWQTAFRNAGYSNVWIRAVEISGFHAKIYKNEITRETVIAFRGTENLSDWAFANLNARIGSIDLQYKSAVDLVRIVKGWSKTARISVTGHSLGGGLASYSGNMNGLENIYTFNAARGPLFNAGNNNNQINVVVPGDVVSGTSESLLSKLAGAGSLPGKNYFVSSSNGDVHSIDGMIGGLEQAIR